MATRVDPFREMERLLDTAFRSPATATTPLDLYRRGDEYVAEFDLPGIDPATIDIDIEDRTLTIRGERRPVAGDVQWLAHERATGTFARQLTLGYGVAMDRIEADYTDGVLTLIIPVAEEAKPRKVSIQHRDRKQVVQGTVDQGMVDKDGDGIDDAVEDVMENTVEPGR